MSLTVFSIQTYYIIYRNTNFFQFVKKEYIFLYLRDKLFLHKCEKYILPETSDITIILLP